MSWTFNRFLRSLWTRTSAAKPRPKPRPSARPALERMEEINPPSSLWDLFTPALAAALPSLAASPSLDGQPSGGEAPGVAAGQDASASPPAAPASGPPATADAGPATSSQEGPQQAGPGTQGGTGPFGDPFADPFANGMGTGGGQWLATPFPSGLPGQGGPTGGGGSGASGTQGGQDLAAPGGQQGGAGAAAAAGPSAGMPFAGQGIAGQPQGPAAGGTAGTSSLLAGAGAAPPEETRQWAQQALSTAGLRFEENAGQLDRRVDYVARGQGYALFLTSTEAVLLLRNPAAADAARGADAGTPDLVAQTAVRLKLVGSDPSAQATASGLSPTRTNYFSGNDEAGWHADVANYGRVEYEGVYDGVDLVYYGTSQGQLEYDFIVKAGKSAGQVRMEFDGVVAKRLDEQGNLVLSTAAGDITQQAPVLYQVRDGQREAVSGGYRLHEDGTVGFDVGAYDSSRDLCIDPVVTYGTVLGGVADEEALGVAVDGAGSAYVTGWTMSPVFPTGGGPLLGPVDTFVAKIGPSGSVVYSTYLSGAGTERGFDIAVDAGGNAFVSGYTNSGGLVNAFPTTAGAWRGSAGLAGSDTFAVKLNATGNALLYSTLMSGAAGASNTGSDGGISIDLAGNAYVVGTSGAVLPLVAPFQVAYGGGVSDAFLVKLNATGTAATLSSFLGGTANDFGTGVALAPNGDIHISGYTNTLTPGGMPAAFPTTPGVFQAALAGGTDAFASRITAAGAVGHTTLLGGAGNDVANDIAVDVAGQAHVVGWTQSPGFPVTSGGFSGAQDAFLTKFNPAGTALVYSRVFLDGVGTAEARGVAVDVAGTAWVGGTTSGLALPLVAPSQPGYGGGPTDAFVARLDPLGVGTLFSTYAGGIASDRGNALALHADGSVYLAGSTNSANFPVAHTPGGYDAYVLKLGDTPPAPVFTGISTDTGVSATDRITNDTTLTLSGTATPGSLVTLFLAGVGVIGTTTANPMTGAWSFAYATALADGVAAFSATATASGKTSVRSADYLATVDLTAPVVTLTAPATTTEVKPEVTVVASDLNGLPNGTAVILDVDLNNDTDYLDPGETGHTASTLVGGAATFSLASALTVGTTVAMRARVTDLAGNLGTSASSGVQVLTVVPWGVGDAGVPTYDPQAGDALLQTGALRVTHALDLDRSGGNGQSGGMSLVYDSGTVGVKPIVQATVQMDNATALPTSIVAQLTWDGAFVGTQTFYPGSTAGVSPGSLVTLAMQVPTAVTGVGRHRWQIDLTINLSGGGTVLKTASGSTFTVENDAGPYGAGWSFSGVDRLYSIAADVPNGLPAGVLRVYGTGGWRFYEDNGAGGYTSPAEDNGTLAAVGGPGGWTYTTPEGTVSTFNAAGMQTRWASADGYETLNYTYIDADGDLQGDDLDTMTAIDGAVTTFGYATGKLASIGTASGRSWAVSVNGSGDLASVTNPDTATRTFSYSSHRLTGDALAGVTDTWGYDPGGSGTLRTVQAGAGGVTTVIASSTRGLGAAWRGKPLAEVSDPLTRVTNTLLDGRGRALEVRAPDGGLWKYTRDAAGRVTNATDALGIQTGYVRDGAGYVTQENLPGGATRTYVYGGPNHALTLFTDERSEQWSYTHDGQGHVLTETNPLSETWTYTYTTAGPLGLVETVKDPLNRVVHTYAYDSLRRMTRDTDYYSNYKEWTYETDGDVSKFRDELGRETDYTSDGWGRRASEVGTISLGVTATTQWAWSGAGLLTGMTDAEGRVDTNDYDSRGLLVKSVESAGSATPATELFVYDAAAQLTGTRDANGWWDYTGYDAAGRVSSHTDEKGYTSRAVHDLAGRATAATDNLGNLTTWAYHARGWVTGQTDAGGTTNYGRNASGDVTSVTDPASHTVTFAIDDLHRAWKTTSHLGYFTEAGFDALGNLEEWTDQRGYVTENTFDALNRLLTTTEAFGTAAARTATNVWDAVGNLEEAYDWLGKMTEWVRDGLDRVTDVIDPLLHTVQQAWDKVGNLLSVEDATNEVTNFIYNALDMNTAATDPNGHTDGTQYDPEGQVVLTTDALGNPAWRAYDERGQLVLEVDARGGTTRRSYDANGNLSVLVDPAGNTWSWQYDRLNREIKRTDPLGKSVVTAYNPAGLVESVTDRLTRKKEFFYDADNRLTSEVWKDALGATVDTRTFTHDAAGNLLTATNAAGTYTRTYDELNRLETQAGLFGVSYAFDYNDRERTEVTDSLGGDTEWVRDDAGRVTRRTFTDGTDEVRIDLGYNARDERTSETRYADIAGTTLVGTTVRGYDDAGNLTGLHYKDAGAATISDYVNVYDAADRITSETRNGGTPVTFSYDTTSQLVADSATSYSYDLAGNRTMAGYTTGAANRITSDGTWAFSYDDEGNVTKRSKGALAETWTYGYDHDNQMTWAEQRATDGGTLLMRLDFTYDVFSQRVKEVKTAGGTTERRYAFADRGEAEAELSSTNTLVTRYNHGEAAGELWSRVGSGGAAWLLQDRLGSLRDVADAAGAGVDHIDYDGFGNVLVETTPSLTGDFTYTGLWRQRESGLFHAFWRDYGASWGGWMQDDPSHIEGGGDPNVRRYVGNNPTNGTDLSGLAGPPPHDPRAHAIALLLKADEALRMPRVKLHPEKALIESMYECVLQIKFLKDRKMEMVFRAASANRDFLKAQAAAEKNPDKFPTAEQWDAIRRAQTRLRNALELHRAYHNRLNLAIEDWNRLAILDGFFRMRKYPAWAAMEPVKERKWAELLDGLKRVDHLEWYLLRKLEEQEKKRKQ